MIALFKQKNPANFFSLLVVGVLLKLPMFLTPHIPVLTGNEGMLYKAFLRFLENSFGGHAIIYPLAAFLFLFIQSVLLTHFINSHRMMNRANYLPGMAFMLVTSLLPEWNYFSAPLLVGVALLYILFILFKIYHQENAKGLIFNIGLALGIASFIYFPSLLFLIWVLPALMVMRPFRLNECVICILGLAAPYYFYGIYLVIVNEWSWQSLWPGLTMEIPVISQSVWLALSVLLFTIPFLVGGYYVQDNLRRMLIQVRKGWSLLLLLLFFSLGIPFVNGTGALENWIIVAVPLAAFHACTYMYSTIRILTVVLFWATVIFILVWQYQGPGW